MGFAIIDKDSNYLASVVRLEKPLPHPNADKLLGWNIHNEIVYTNAEYAEGDYVVHFPIGAQLEPTMLRYFNAYANSKLNIDPNVKGYFNDAGVVKAIRLRGEPSFGVIFKWSIFTEYLQHFYNDTNMKFNIPNNLMFDSYNDPRRPIRFCTKYVPIETLRAVRAQNSKGFKRDKVHIVEGQFNKHYSTPKITDGGYFKKTDNVYITKKLHGTSGICANLLVNKNLSFLEEVAKFFKFKIKDTEYKMIYASRNRKVGGDAIHARAAKYVEDKVIANYSAGFPEGMSIYYEIVGYDYQKFIQKNYDYGCKFGEFKVYIYRITEVDKRGTVIEWPFSQVVHFCNHINIPTVPVLYKGMLEFYMPSRNYKDKTYFTKLIEKLRKDFTEKNETMCLNPVPEEGICIRKDSGRAYKLKSFRFLELEGMQADVNIEDVS